jgi:glycosyltransferase involved in cell wall biosynthesis
VKVLHLNYLPLPVNGSSLGGMEEFVYNLDKYLTLKGHSSSVFANPDSSLYNDPFKKRLLKYPGYLVETYQNEENWEVRESIKSLLQGYQLQKIMELRDKIDLVHNHSYADILINSDLLPLRMVTTLHMDIKMFNYLLRDLRRIPVEKINKNILISVSESQKRKYEEEGYKIYRNIYNGVDLDRLFFQSECLNYYVCFGRFIQRKGVHLAIQAALAAGKNIVLGGRVFNLERSFFEKKVKPFFDFEFTSFKQEALKEFLVSGKNVGYYGLVDSYNKKNTLLGNARAMLFPPEWDEPFGLVIAEAMACGTPLIAYAKGAVPEIVVDGVTGFIVNSSDEEFQGDWLIKKTGVEGLCEAMEKIDSMSPEKYRHMRIKCRERVGQYFSVTRMTEKYIQLYEEAGGLT